jgi:hypothetical protein
VVLVAAVAVADPAVTSVQFLAPADQSATPTVAFLLSDTELPAETARDVTAAFDVPAVDVRRLLVGADLVKLDVEGQEHALLAAGRDLLRERRPTVFVEVSLEPPGCAPSSPSCACGTATTDSPRPPVPCAASSGATPGAATVP